MKKLNKIVAMLISVIMIMQVLAITSFAEDVYTFPPQRPTVGNMKITTGGAGYSEVFIGLRTNGTINIKADLNSWGDGITSNLKDRLLSLTDVVDVAGIFNTVVALKSNGTVYVGQNTQEDIIMSKPFDKLQPLNEAANWTDIVAIECGEHHLVGLKADGTVVATGDNSYGQCDVMGWNNVSEIYANDFETLAIRKDGTVLATGAVQNFSEIRKMKNVKKLFHHHPGVITYAAPHNYQAVFTDGTVSCNMDYYEGTGEIVGGIPIKKTVSLPINEVFAKCGYNTKIVDLQTIDSDKYYVLDDAGDFYLLSSDYTNKVKVEKLEEKIISFMSSLSDYYALDENGQILSNKAAFTSSDWILTTNITYDGKKIGSDVPPYVKDGRTLAPIRAILEALGMTVSWDGATQTATAVKGNITISVSINSNIAYVNGQQKTLDVPAEITNGRTFVPVRFFGEALGMNVDWDGYTKTVIIESK